MAVITMISIITASSASMMMTQRFSLRSTSSCGTTPLGRGRSSGLEASPLANGTSRQVEEEIKEEPADEQQPPHRYGAEHQRAERTVLERPRGGLRPDWSGHVLRRMSRGPMRRVDVRGDRLFGLCGH